MEVKIGVQHATREIVVDTPATQEEVAQQVEKAIADGGLLVLTDQRGRLIAVPGDKLAYVEIGGGVAGKVGFGH